MDTPPIKQTYSPTCAWHERSRCANFYDIYNIVWDTRSCIVSIHGPFANLSFFDIHLNLRELISILLMKYLRVQTHVCKNILNSMIVDPKKEFPEMPVVTPFLCNQYYIPDQHLASQRFLLWCVGVSPKCAQYWTCASNSLISIGDKLAWVLVKKLLALILVKMSALFSVNSTKLILITLSSK